MTEATTETRNPDDAKKKCPDLPAPKKPDLPEPKDCEQPCCCPPKPGGPDANCLITLIDDQAKVVKAAETAKAFVEELTTLQKDAAEARAKYTPAKYADMVRQWKDQDVRIADVIHNLVCSVHCWQCLLDCRYCPLLYDIAALERRLYGTGTFPTKVDSLQELYCWQERNRDARKDVCGRIKKVLDAWKDPAKTLADVLDKNDKLIDEVKNLIAKDTPTAVYKLFAVLVPTHWAIKPEGVVPLPDSPPATPDPKQSAIKAGYIRICTCGDEPPETCCGPNTGPLSVRDRLIGPQPYLVDPGKFFEIICCLANERYLPAKNLLADAEAELAKTKDEIERTKKLIEDRTASLEDDFKAELTTPIDCSKYWPKSSPSDPCDKQPKPTGC